MNVTPKKSIYLETIAVLLCTSLFLPSSVLSSPYSELNDITIEHSIEQEPRLSQAEVEQVLAPIALYPDTLLSHILIASTYPIEVIEAERWLNKNTQLTSKQLENKAQKKHWDASIKVLLAFPQVLTKLSDDLGWMQAIGNAFLQDETSVLKSIQTLRLRAEAAGSLDNIDNVQIIKEHQTIIIESAQPEVIYVPYYDTRIVYGHWSWVHNPPVYWHKPRHYSPHHGNFYWGLGVRISSEFYFSTFHWNKSYVVVNHGNNYKRYSYHARKKMIRGHKTKRWNHQPKHRRGVVYSNDRLKKKYYGSRAVVHKDKGYKKTLGRLANHKVKMHVNKVNKNKSIHRNKVVKSTIKQKHKVANKIANKRGNKRAKHIVKHHRAVKAQPTKKKVTKTGRIQQRVETKYASTSKAKQAKQANKNLAKLNKRHQHKENKK